MKKEIYPVPTVIDIEDARSWWRHKECQRILNKERAKRNMAPTETLSLGEYIARFGRRVPRYKNND